MKEINKTPLKQHPLKVVETITLLDFLREKLAGQSNSSIKATLTKGLVWVNGKNITQYNYILVPDDIVEIRKFQLVSPTFKHPKLKIVFEDDDIIVVEKAAGLLSVGTDKEQKKTAYHLLNEYVKLKDSKSHIFVVHRLDKETSGVMLFAKNENAQKKLQHNWNYSVIERTYIAIVEGVPNKMQGIISSYLWESKSTKMYSSHDSSQGQKAVTRYEVIEENGISAKVKLNLQTGRKNQIRVHLQSIGHPIVGDNKYGSTTNPFHRLALHALNITFIHPITREELFFEMKFPAQLQLLNQLNDNDYS